MISSEKLQQFPIFFGMEPVFLERLASFAEEVTLKDSEWVFREHENADALYLISRGTVELKLKLDEKTGAFITLNTLHNGDPLGWSAIVDPYVYKLGALTSGSTSLVKLDAQALRGLLQEMPEQGYLLMQGITQAMASRVDTLSEKVPSLSLRTLISLILFAVGAVTGVLVIGFGLSALYGAAQGKPESVPTALLCLIVPAVFLFLARRLYPSPNHAG